MGSETHSLPLPPPDAAVLCPAYPGSPAAAADSPPAVDVHIPHAAVFLPQIFFFLFLIYAFGFSQDFFFPFPSPVV